MVKLEGNQLISLPIHPQYKDNARQRDHTVLRRGFHAHQLSYFTSQLNKLRHRNDLILADHTLLKPAQIAKLINFILLTIDVLPV